jgi:drug/metabolite transporter (DMT)-like permease
MNKTTIYHLLAIFVVLVWGTTYISAKVLLKEGLEAHEIYLLRFILAYVCMLFISSKKMFADSWHDEFRLMLLGLTGGTMYFVMQNLALEYTYANNVSFIVACSPLMATLITLAIYKDVKPNIALIGGSLVALLGVAMVIFNGQFVLKLNPVGDMLSLGAGLSWAIYSVIIKRLTERYDVLFITRKVFFYGLVTVIPVFIFWPWSTPVSVCYKADVVLNLLYLGIVASFFCFFAWSFVLQKLGVIRGSNYIYLGPICTMLASAFFLDETVTVISFIGSILILLGVFWAGKGTSSSNA